ncbi:leucine dehydrogenase [Modicisalibacter ilicicola DSM 19980]|uniref:Leucine dehydrogenase n=1 Tax=Modicisalibacter ilicicola DSM 19980 TaxID=1121942 RepID=A0A1M4XDI4_9GAMM|nr:Glu/Leu/Phe/Val dehydrogenase [Halomonas ilicicola]SHE91312.1 leucine dehydrogenase [Halomonas ilicicola DSM 19980]
MTLFAHPDFDHHEQVVYGSDRRSGLQAIIAIHNTCRGPALGGLRIYPYPTEERALADVLRLARGMTYKSALANLPLGGGKAVIIADPKRQKTPALLEAMGRLIATQGGRYITAEDSGSSEQDMRVIAGVTEHVSGLRRQGEESGDPSPFTAWGVFNALRCAVRHGFERDDLAGLRVAIQGVGHVGAHLARHLHAAGARLVLADVDTQAVKQLAKELQADIVSPLDIFAVDADIFAPCAMGAVLDSRVCERLKARIVVGAANNQLATAEMADRLHQRGILYTPDYVANAGGLIEVAWQRREDYSHDRVMAHIASIERTLDEIFDRASQEQCSPAPIADRLAEERFSPLFGQSPEV